MTSVARIARFSQARPPSHLLGASRTQLPSASMLGKELSEGVTAAFADPQPPRVEVGVEVSRSSTTSSPSHSPNLHVATQEATIGGEAISLALVVEGRGGAAMADWCARHLLPAFVRLAANNPSGRALQRAGAKAFRMAHDAARDVAASGRAGCTATLCAVNRHRREVITCNVGALAALLVSKGRMATLTSDHTLESCAAERQRMMQLGLQLAHASDECGGAKGPLRVWPSGQPTARAIGFLSAGEAIDPTPSVSTMTLPLAAGSDVVLGSSGVWDELLASSVAGIVRATPLASAAAALVVARASTTAKSKVTDETAEGEDVACVVLSLLSVGESPLRISYLEARAANQKKSPLASRHYFKHASQLPDTPLIAPVSPELETPPSSLHGSLEASPSSRGSSYQRSPAASPKVPLNLSPHLPIHMPSPNGSPPRTPFLSLPKQHTSLWLPDPVVEATPRTMAAMAARTPEVSNVTRAKLGERMSHTSRAGTNGGANLPRMMRRPMAAVPVRGALMAEPPSRSDRTKQAPACTIM